MTTLDDRLDKLETALTAMANTIMRREDFGDAEGHEFHGNQWTHSGNGRMVLVRGMRAGDHIKTATPGVELHVRSVDQKTGKLVVHSASSDGKIGPESTRQFDRDRKYKVMGRADSPQSQNVSKAIAEKSLPSSKAGPVESHARAIEAELPGYRGQRAADIMRASSSVKEGRDKLHEEAGKIGDRYGNMSPASASAKSDLLKAANIVDAKERADRAASPEGKAAAQSARLEESLRDASGGRVQSLHDVDRERLERGLADAQRSGNDYASVKIPSGSEVSIPTKLLEDHLDKRTGSW